MAERLGPIATILERLVHRDGHTVEEAMEIVRTNHAVALTYAELRALWGQLPVRARTTEVSEDAAGMVVSPDSSEANVDDAARKQDIGRLERALQSAFEALPAQDRLMVALRFDHDMPVADIARTLQSSVPTVHRRIAQSLKNLRAALAGSGFDPHQVSGLIGHSTVVLSPLLRAEVERFLKRVRLFKRDG